MEYSFNYRFLSLDFGYKMNVCLRERDRQTDRDREHVFEGIEKTEVHYGGTLRDRSTPSNYMLNLNYTIIGFQ